MGWFSVLFVHNIFKKTLLLQVYMCIIYTLTCVSVKVCNEKEQRICLEQFRKLNIR